MLARGLLCRLAADVPKTSTHDLSQLTRLIHRAAITHKATSIRSICAVPHAYKLPSAIHRRSYVTAKTKPATRTTRAKTTVKKTRATKKSAPKKSVPKKAAPKKKTTAAKRRAAPKKKAKAKVVKKPLSEKTLEKAAAKKARDELNELKKKALAEPKKRPYTAWTVYIAENIKNAVSNGQKRLEGVKQLAQFYKDFTPAEREHYNHLANQNQAANETEYKAWVLRHTPQQIRDANFARLALKRKHKMTGSKVVRIEDDRQAKSPKNGILFFMMERRESGDFKDIPLIEATKLMASEYKTLSAGEKKKYEDMAAADKTRYYRDFESSYGYKAKAEAAASP